MWGLRSWGPGAPSGRAAHGEERCVTSRLLCGCLVFRKGDSKCLLIARGSGWRAECLLEAAWCVSCLL